MQAKNKLHFLPRNLLARVLLILWLPMFLVQGVLTFIFIDRHWQTTTKELAQHIAQKTAFIHMLVEASPDPETLVLLAKNTLGSTLLVRDQPFRPLPSQDFPGASLLKQALHETVLKQATIHISNDVLRIYFPVMQSKVQRYACVVMPTKRFLSRTTPIFLMWSAGMPLLLFIIAAFFMRNQIKPITRLSQAMERFGKGQDDTYLKPAGATEIRQGTIAFNQMQQRLKKYITQRTHMLAGVSHDLKTPLTRMRLVLAMMQEKPMAKALDDDITIMTNIINDYISFAKGDHQVSTQEISLRSFIHKTVYPFTLPIMQEKTTPKITMSIPLDLTISIREHALGRALSNILDNAMKYGTIISVSTEITNKLYKIIIQDNGPGIRAADREHVMQPFVRLEGSRNLETGGVGLGLAISRDIILAHGGNMILGDSPSNGLQVTIVLPQSSGGAQRS